MSFQRKDTSFQRKDEGPGGQDAHATSIQAAGLELAQ